MNIKITADSTCDLSEELLRQWNISLMPMHILMGDDTYLDGVTIHPADVFAHVDAGGQTRNPLPQTRGVHRFLRALCHGVRRRHPHLGQRQTFLLLPERLPCRTGI